VPPGLPARTARVAAPDVAVVATFWPDEPIAAIMEAAAALPDVRFAISGPVARFRETGAAVPSNVRLTGFLPDPAYWSLLAQAAVILDLTLKSDCLVCGAYEGLALAKPLVLSDNPASRELFGPAAVLTGSSPEAIASALRKALAEREQLAANARALRETFRTRWSAQADAAWDGILAGALAAARSRARLARR
jgi:glycosyltransferase involved in cell wall biosynthesis